MKLFLNEEKLNRIIKENLRKIISESFKSDSLRSWFKEHGGVMNRYEGEEYDYLKDKRVRQDGLGDVSDEDILSVREFDDYNDACNYCWSLNHPKSKYGNGNLPFDNKALYTVYRAKDGSSVVVGLDKNKVETTTTWGGEMTKKTGDRIWANGWNPKTRSNRYVDDSDRYYYSRDGQYFGLHNNDNFHGKMRGNRDIKSAMDDDEWNDYSNRRVQHIRDYKRNKIKKRP